MTFQLLIPEALRSPSLQPLLHSTLLPCFSYLLLHNIPFPNLWFKTTMIFFLILWGQEFKQAQLDLCLYVIGWGHSLGCIWCLMSHPIWPAWAFSQHGGLRQLDFQYGSQLPRGRKWKLPVACKAWAWKYQNITSTVFLLVKPSHMLSPHSKRKGKRLHFLREEWQRICDHL